MRSNHSFTYMPAASVVTLVLILFVSNVSGALGGAVNASRLRAVVLGRIALSVRWPSAHDPAARDTPITIGVMGDESRFHVNTLRQMAASMERRQGVRLEVVELPELWTIDPDHMAEFLLVLKKCHILFIGSDLEDDYEEILAKVKGAGVLTVGEHAEFCYRNGMLCLHINNNRLNIMVNMKSLKDSGISISSEVLRHATII